MDHFSYTFLHMNSTAWFGLILLLGIFGGELVTKVRFFPRILGYIAVGFLIGPGGLGIIDSSILQQSSLFIDISLGLILFTIGRHLDFKWLSCDRYLLWMSLTESGTTFILLFIALSLLSLSWLSAALIATIAIVTSPAVLIMITHDLNAHGPVTRRALILTSLNNLYGLIIFMILLPFTQSHVLPWSQIFFQISYNLFGATLLALLMFIIAQLLAFLIGKIPQRQFVLFVGITILTIGLARMLHLSTMLALFILGMAVRNFDWHYRLTVFNFETLARFFLIVLFVLVGIYLQPRNVWQASLPIAIFIAIRLIAKFSGVFLFRKPSRLTQKQTLATALALMPMAGVALGMSFMLINLDSELGTLVIMIVSGALAIMDLAGPLCAQWAFLIVDEAAHE